MFKRLRSRLFGFKKSDVYDYIAEMDERATEQLIAKDKEIEELKGKIAECEEKIAELEKNKEAIVSVLLTADKTAKDIISEAKSEAESMRKTAEEEIQSKKETNDREIREQKDCAEREIQEQKNSVNREIETKRKAIKSYYTNENRKIDQIKNEVERMRKASMEAIQNFEMQLREVERMSENSSSFLESAKEYAGTGALPEIFSSVERNIPVHIVESISD